MEKRYSNGNGNGKRVDNVKLRKKVRRFFYTLLDDVL